MSIDWKIKYNYQLAGWIVYNRKRGIQLKEIFADQIEASKECTRRNLLEIFASPKPVEQP